MTGRKLRGYVLPTIYVLAIATVAISILLIGRTIRSFNEQKADESQYVMDETSNILNDEEIPVVNEDKEKRTIKPFSSDKVVVSKEYYDSKATPDKQQNALIYYEGTYMQNSGILYTAPESFDVVAVMDGTIANIKEDDILGIIIEIEHNSKLTTVYQSLKEAKVTVGQEIKQGDVIGISGTNKIEPKNTNSLLFEVFHKGALINPNEFYGVEIESFNE